MTVSFTGHRNIPFSAEPAINERLDATIISLIKKGVDTFICGGALGFDTLAAKRVLAARNNYPIKLILALPCGDQAKRWSVKNKAMFEYIKGNADQTVVLFDHYITGCMHARDKYMVNNSDIVVAYYRGQLGGTQFTLKYAEEQSKQILLI